MPPTSAAAYNQLQDFQKNRVSADTARSNAEQKYGVGALDSQLSALRTLTGNLETSINNVDPSVTGRTQGSLVTEAQRQRIVNQERDPLLKDYNTNMRNYGDVGDQYNRATANANNYTNQVLGEQDTGYNNLFNQYNSLLDQEKSAAAIAEQKRQFDAQMAASRANSLNLDALFRNATGRANAAMANGPSQQQVNAALWLQQNGGAGSARDYTSQPVPAGQYYLPNQVGSGIGNALQFIPNAANATSNFFGGLLGLNKKK